MQHTPEQTLQRWHALLAAWQLKAESQTHQALIAAYAQPHRHYHHFGHIMACLAHLDQHHTLCLHPEEIEMAVWFHDAVYAIFSSHNEADSAAWAHTFLHQCDAPAIKIARVVKMILLTQTHTAPEDDDSAMLLDIDLAILGEATPIFQAYEKHIRDEYAAVPSRLFKQKRRAILQHFLAQPWLYTTPTFRHSHETLARENIAWAIAQL